MKIKLVNLSGTEIGKIDLPNQFSEEIRPDLIKRAVLVVQSHNRQRKGASPEAGKRSSAKLSRRRRNYRGGYGHGISRVPRKITWRRGTQFGWVGAVAPGTRGGRQAHPPKSEKNLTLKINTKERRKAIRSALACTMIKELVEARGHKVPKEFPIAIETKFQDLTKSKDVKATLEKIGLKEDLIRTSKKKVRAGKGKSRGRKYQRKKGPLIIVSKECALQKSAKNLPGVDIEEVKNLNAELLAPGTHIGRLTLFTQEALEVLKKENLFYNKK